MFYRGKKKISILYLKLENRYEMLKYIPFLIILTGCTDFASYLSLASEVEDVIEALEKPQSQ